MKKLIKMSIIIVIIAVFSLVCSAEAPEDYLSDFQNIIPEDSPFFGVPEKDITSVLGVETLFSELLSGERLGGAFSFLVSLLGIIALMGVASSLGERGSAAEGVVGILCSSVLLSGLLPLFSEAAAAMEKINLFFLSLSPLMVSLTLAGGGHGTAAVQSTGAAAVTSLVELFTGKLFISIISLSFAASSLAALGDGGIKRLSGAVRSIFLWLLGIATAILSAVLGLQTLIASGADSAGMRAAKYAASGMIPIVGTSISGALSTLASGLSYVKDIVGGVSVGVIIFYFLSPLITLLLYRLALSVAVFTSELVGSTAAGIFTSFRFSLDSLTAVYALSSLLYIFEIVLFIKSGVALS